MVRADSRRVRHQVRGCDVLTMCWAAKGGSGTTVVSCALALLTAESRKPTFLIDMAGDVPAALGLPEPPGPGIHDWVLSPSAPLQSFIVLGSPGTDGLMLVPRGAGFAASDLTRWDDLGRFLAESTTDFIVDAGSSSPPPALAAAAQHRLLVIRPCYLALRRAAASTPRPTGVIVVHEPGRALRAQDVAYAVQAPVVAEVSTDPAVARAVDAGLLAARLPRTLAASLRVLVA